jgi:SAM-dependent methyltransferase
VTGNAFDEYAETYTGDLDKGLSVTGESRDHFALGRVNWLAGCLRDIGAATPAAILDYGCGDGSTSPLLRRLAPAARFLGVDVSADSLELARKQFGSDGARFDLVADTSPTADMDVAYCNGIFHHILPLDRPAAARYVHASLKPGGVFSFWENNPWNPGSRWVMSRIPFDRDAIMVSALEAKQLLVRAGFEILRCDFLFFVPHALKMLRPLEPKLAKLPLGGQYQVLCRKPALR